METAMILSSQLPMLQNIPIKSEHGRQIRGGFVRRDRHIVNFDFSGLEMRLYDHYRKQYG
jgi:DNA polymerase-1